MPRSRSRPHIPLGDKIPRILLRQLRRNDILVEVARRGLDDGFDKTGVDLGRRVLENGDVVVPVVGRVVLGVGGQQQIEFLGVLVCALLEGRGEALGQVFEFFDFEADRFDDFFDFDFVVQRPDAFGAEAWLRLGGVAAASGGAEVHILQFFSNVGDVDGFVYRLIALGCLGQAFEVVFDAVESQLGELAILDCVGRCTCAVGLFPAAESAPEERDNEGVFLIVSGTVPASVEAVENGHA